MKKVLIIGNMPLGFKLPEHLASDVTIIPSLEERVRSIKNIEIPQLNEIYTSFVEDDKPNYLTSKKLPKRKK